MPVLPGLRARQKAMQGMWLRRGSQGRLQGLVLPEGNLVTHASAWKGSLAGCQSSGTIAVGQRTTSRMSGNGSIVPLYANLAAPWRNLSRFPPRWLGPGKVFGVPWLLDRIGRPNLRMCNGPSPPMMAPEGLARVMRA
jgi:hypothetical protein